MDLEAKNEAVLRKYLLGELSDADEQALEERLLADEQLSRLLLAEEDELVDDYLSGDLSEGECERFDGYFLVTPDRRRKLSFGETLSRYKQGSAASGGPERTPAEREPEANESVGNNSEAKDSGTKDPGAKKTAPGLQPPSAVVIGPPSWWRRAYTSQYLRAATVAMVLGLGFGTWRAFIYQSDIDRGVELLARAFSNERPTDARISGWSYAPRQNIRGSTEEKTDRVGRDKAESLIFAAASGDAKSFRALGLLYVARHDFPTAKEQFEKALALDPNNARLQSDYGAALLEAGKASQSEGRSGAGFEEFAGSLEHLGKALELDDSLLEAMFNRALCKEYMVLRRAAADDWRAYLVRDANSKWSDEARERLAALERSTGMTSGNGERPFEAFLEASEARDAGRTWTLIIQNRDQQGSSLENKLISDYLNLAAGARRQDASRLLDGLAFAAEVRQRHGGDRFALDVVQFYRSASPSQRYLASQARSLIDAGHKNYSNTDFDSALDCYNRGKETFERAGSACEAMHADYLVGLCYVQQSKVELGISKLKSLALKCEEAQYNCLLSQALTGLCGANQLSRDFSEALNHINRSIGLCEAMDDAIGASRARYQLGEVYRFVENGRKALDVLARDLPLAQTYSPKPAPLWARYFSISRAFDQLKLVRASIDFQNEALRFAKDAKVPRLVCRSLNYLGLLLSKSARYDDAESSIESALEIGNSLREGAVKTEVIAYSFLQLGSLFRKSRDFKSALENYDKAIQSYDEIDNKFFAFTARKDKLLCCMEQGACPSVEQELERVLNLFEDQRTKILEDGNRSTFFDAEQGIYDVAIEFEYKKNDRQKAFEYSERSRGRSLADLASAGARIVDSADNPDVAPLPSSWSVNYGDIPQHVPERSQILQYAVLKDSLLIWVVSAGGISMETRRISIDELSERVNSFLRLVSNGSGADIESFSREALHLYDLLIRPVELKLDSSKQLCIVPDKILNYLPFGALMPRASTYFIEERDIMLSPSTNIFNMCSAYAQEKQSSSGERGLIVGNPAFNAGDYGHLGNLESAADEAKTIAGYYRVPAITGAAATKERVMSEMERSEVIHLATHAITDEWDPRRSKLLLAKGPAAAAGDRNDGVLQACEIYKLDLSRVKLVVLSACQSAVERYYGGEGMVGLSRPFIAQRIPLVVASLWPVESRSTARLMTSFHRYRKTGSGMPTVPALCKAQRDMLSAHGADRLPRNWASFVAIGGYANF